MPATQYRVFVVAPPAGWSLLVPADPARRLLVIQPDALVNVSPIRVVDPILGYGLWVESGATGKLVADWKTWGSVLQQEWYIFSGGGINVYVIEAVC